MKVGANTTISKVAESNCQMLTNESAFQAGSAFEIKVWDETDKQYRCKLALESGAFVYYEHFASNSETPCLAWVECRVEKAIPGELPEEKTNPIEPQRPENPANSQNDS